MVLLLYILTIYLNTAVWIYNCVGFLYSLHLHSGWDSLHAIVLLTLTFQCWRINVYFSNKYAPCLKNSWLQYVSSRLQCCHEGKCILEVLLKFVCEYRPCLNCRLHPPRCQCCTGVWKCEFYFPTSEELWQQKKGNWEISKASILR